MTEELGFIPAAPFSVEDYVIQKELLQALYAALDGLDKEQRKLVIVYYFEDMSEEKTAEKLGLTKGKVHHRIEKIIEILQEKLKDFR